MTTSRQRWARPHLGAAQPHERLLLAIRRYGLVLAPVNVALGLGLAGLPAHAHGQGAPADSATHVIGAGVTLRRLALPEGPWVVHVLAVDLAQGGLAVHAARACDRLTGRERPSAIAARLRTAGADVVGVINAGFFDLEGGTGTSENNVVVDGEIVKGVGFTESPFGRRNTVRSQFAIEADGRPAIDRFRLAGSVRSRLGRWSLASLNGAPAPDGVSLYTRWTLRPPRFPASQRAVSIPLELSSERGDTLRYRVLADRRDTIADGTAAHALLVGTGKAAAGIAALRVGDRITVVATMTPGGTPRELVGGWPAIVREGTSIAASADSLEGTFPAFSAKRHPRSAVGITRGRDTLLLVAVDGRQAASVGMSLVELAGLMRRLGAWDALNLDGGGSTTLVVRDSVVNTPSDPTGERPVGDVLIVTRGPAPRRELPARTVAASCVVTGNRDPDR